MGFVKVHFENITNSLITSFNNNLNESILESTVINFLWPKKI